MRLGIDDDLAGKPSVVDNLDKNVGTAYPTGCAAHPILRSRLSQQCLDLRVQAYFCRFTDLVGRPGLESALHVGKLCFELQLLVEMRIFVDFSV
jgi:hypothetical protein